MEVEKEMFMEEGIDLRFFLLRLWKSIWIVCVAALAGAAICAGGYMAYKQIFPAAKEYMAETKYYIDFAEDSTGIGYGYYNDYTWNDLMKSDDILLYTMTLLPETIAKDTVEAAVVADIISDVRLLTITVTTNQEELTNQIAEATAKSLAHFPEDIKEIDAIRVIREDKAAEVIVDDLTKNWGIFGFVCGAVVSLLGLWLVFCMDSSVYLPKDIEKRFQIPVLGVVYKAGEERADLEDNRSELLASLSYMLKGKNRIALVDFGKNQQSGAIAEIVRNETKAEVRVEAGAEAKTVGKVYDYEALRQADAVIVCFNYGVNDGKRVERALAGLKKQDCKITGAILCGADKKMYRRYYFSMRMK